MGYGNRILSVLHLIGNSHGIDNRSSENSDVGYSLDCLGPWPLPDVC